MEATSSEEALELADQLAEELAAHGARGAHIALVCGSGLGDIANEMEVEREIGFDELDAMPGSSVPGHAGRFLRGTLAGVPVLVQQGRVHLYEGHTGFAVTRTMRAFARLGIGGVVLTNAAGGLHASWKPGTLMRLRDHINLQRTTALLRSESSAGSPYDPTFGSALDAAAEEANVPLEVGVYLGLTGPTYETPAEVRMLAELGADAVGMSTVLEATAAHAEGLRVAAFSLVTNPGAGLAPGALNHEEVVEAGRAAAESVIRFLRCALPRLNAVLSA